METNNRPRFFNSGFEFGLRILLLLSEATEWPLSSGSIICVDFMAVYGKEFEVSESNLHGDGDYKLNELTSRNELFDIAIKDLVVRGLVHATLSNGFQYEITDAGENFISQLDNPYSERYREAVGNVFSQYDVKDSVQLDKIIRQMARRKDGQ